MPPLFQLQFHPLPPLGSFCGKRKLKKLRFFCGAHIAEGGGYLEMAERTGSLLAGAKIDLVYGGGAEGMMGAVARGSRNNGGQVWGVTPGFMLEEGSGQVFSRDKSDKLIVVEDMHQRKSRMYQLSDAFFILPGGIGTLDEFFEIWTWAKLSLHKRPVYLINHDNFYGHLLAHIQEIDKQGLLPKKALEVLVVVKTPEEALNHFLMRKPSAP